MVTGGWIGGTVGTEDDIGGITSADEDGIGEKNEGFTRFAASLLLPMLDSLVSMGSIKGVVDIGMGVADIGTGADCIVGNAVGMTLDMWEDTGIAAEGSGNCPDMVAFPTFIAALKKTERSSWTSLIGVAAHEGGGSKGPSVIDKLGTASSSSNSLLVNGTLGFGGTLE